MCDNKIIQKNQGGNLMYQQFDNGVANVMATLTSDSHRRANRHYFVLFREHLVKTDLPYSHQAALDWLSENEYAMPQWKFTRCRTAVFMLDDFLTNGKVTSIGRYPFDNAPKYVKLSSWSKSLLDSVLAKTAYTGNSKNFFRVAVAEFLFFLEEHGMKDPEEISVGHLAAYLRYMKKDRNNIACCRTYVRYVEEFLSELSPSPVFHILTQMKKIFSTIILDDLPNEQKNVFTKAIEAGISNAMPICGFLEAVQSEDDELAVNHYSFRTRRHYMGFCKSFGIFLLLNGLDFSPQLVRCWADYCGRKLAMYPRLIDYAAEPAQSTVKDDIKRLKIAPAQKNTTALPTWSNELLEKYIVDERRRGQAQSTLETQRYACLRFLCFLEQRDIASCEKITPDVLKDFNLYDHHVTPEGKKSYNSRIGRFLGFLGEQGLVPETLRLALPCKTAKKVAIVTTLDDDEVSLLYSKKDRAESPLDLRDVAIAMIILHTGLRAGDVASLKYSDISWKNRTMSICQNKTGKALILPMPITVGNCIYRYLTQGRHKSESDYVFLSSKAPYSKLRSSACAAAIKRMLCAGAQEKKGYGSRIVRKTFASRMLKSGNSAESIANMLGHDGIHTVMTYLSTDDERMSLCAISAGKVVQA
jgi:site-specific recombinase XerD